MRGRGFPAAGGRGCRLVRSDGARAPRVNPRSRNRCEWPQQLPALPTFPGLRTLILTGCRITWQQARAPGRGEKATRPFSGAEFLTFCAQPRFPWGQVAALQPVFPGLEELHASGCGIRTLATESARARAGVFSCPALRPVHPPACRALRLTLRLRLCAPVWSAQSPRAGATCASSTSRTTSSTTGGRSSTWCAHLPGRHTPAPPRNASPAPPPPLPRPGRKPPARAPLSARLAQGALPQLEKLHLGGNRIPALFPFAEPSPDGSPPFPKISAVFLGDNKLEDWRARSELRNSPPGCPGALSRQRGGARAGAAGSAALAPGRWDQPRALPRAAAGRRSTR